MLRIVRKSMLGKKYMVLSSKKLKDAQLRLVENIHQRGG